ncbi:phosphatidylinositol glycan anchor biosynthesis class U protein [Selaginella moellendorffii]|uniref:phosphatidylinositol glycan anchor biosynthesis class U protein n=1 Tax=Selaginella moellendorffii TaxID=88036 RepID=UPI000D1C4B6B|nr:phosphatidylinositol glycan anchor biosynthesis class U protein [Selaginella moellendorffii]|eukprot:XP_024514763.1 phosphatidylinositol glycan anchor biosynthesis class U protein [Selaginella moellendorffii]
MVLQGRRSLALWGGMTLAAIARLLLLMSGASARLSRSVEIATPVTSLVRLEEGFWLKKLGLSPYAGSVYHGSPLLLEIIGPLGANSPILFLLSDFATALLIILIGKRLSAARDHYTRLLELPIPSQGETLDIGEIAALLYLFNPFTVFVCVGGSTSSFESFVVCLALYASLEGNAPLAAFAWVMASHFAMYPLVLLIPIASALCCGPDKPRSKIFRLKSSESLKSSTNVQWQKLWSFILWSAVWSSCVLGLCNRILRHDGGLGEMLRETYGFILTVKDLTPNIGVYWYFFTEVFDFYRSFFLMVFHGNIFCMIAPLSICFYHRPIFLSFILMAVVSTLKSYPSVGDAALYLGLMGLFTHELSDFKYAFLLLNSYICVAALGPVMFNLWIWRGTGNANFYFATALAYAFVQTILIVESVNSMLRFERGLKLTIKTTLSSSKKDN